MPKMTIRDIDLNGKRVLMRVDFNVPLDKTQHITDDTRITATLPTIQYAIAHGAKLILMAHLGRPDGKRVPEMSLAPAAKRLSELLGKPVTMLPDCVGPQVEAAVNAMKPGDVVMLENLRFNPGEKDNVPEFAKQLAALGEVYVNDSFGTAHNKTDASTVGVPALFKPALAGLLMEKEIQNLSVPLKNPERPFVAVLGGAKVSDKIGIIKNLLTKVDCVLVGGAMAYAFLKAQGISIGKSKFDPEDLAPAQDILKLAFYHKDRVEFLLPEDHVIADQFAENAKTQVVKGSIPDGWFGLDIGPETAKKYAAKIKTAKTVVWNGPMGVFEMKPFAAGTRAVALAMAESKAKTIIGGGESVAAVTQAGVASKMTHISTGGGASLKFLEGKTLPGVAALTDK